MIAATDFKNGITIEMEGVIYSILEFQHVKPGKGAAFVRTRLKNITHGGIIEKTFRPSEKFSKAIIERENMQYLYKDTELYYFMNNETFEQIEVEISKIKDSMKFIKENSDVKILFHKGKIIDIEAPITVELEVTETEPGFKGNTSQGATKPCTVETGETVYVPLFVNIGDKIKIDTRTSDYMNRV